MQLFGENVTSWQPHSCVESGHITEIKSIMETSCLNGEEDSVSDEAISRGWEFATPHWLVSEAAQTPWNLPKTLLRHDSSDQALLRSAQFQLLSHHNLFPGSSAVLHKKKKTLKSFSVVEFHKAFSSCESLWNVRINYSVSLLNWTKSVSGVISWREQAEVE